MRLTKDRSQLQELARLPLQQDDVAVLFNTKDYKPKLVELIKSAKRRIYMSALYWQNDEAGQQLMHAVYQAKQHTPSLDVKIFVDFHRAQRGLIGAEAELGNAQFYQQCQQQYQHPIDIYGVPVKSKELLGVLHLKGFVFDERFIRMGRFGS